MHVFGWVVIGLTGLWLAGVAAGGRRPAWSGGGRRPPGPSRVRDAVHDLEAQVRRLGEMERFVLGKLLRREAVARNPCAEFEAGLSVGERVADRVAYFGGSWTFIFLAVMAMVVWVAANVETAEPFDPFPFILLNLVLSCLAALQAPVIMMSQNRQAAKDRLEAQHDYEVNLKAEMEILALHAKVDELRARQWEQLVAMQERQEALLHEIASRLGEA
jgi:uncharacterized membrane protein